MCKRQVNKYIRSILVLNIAENIVFNTLHSLYLYIIYPLYSLFQKKENHAIRKNVGYKGSLVMMTFVFQIVHQGLTLPVFPVYKALVALKSVLKKKKIWFGNPYNCEIY